MKKSKGVEYESDYTKIKKWAIIRVEELETRKDKRLLKIKALIIMNKGNILKSF